MDDDSATEDALGADQLDELVRDGALGVALGVGLEVAQVADVALAVGGGAVGLVVGVDWMKREGMSVMVLLLLVVSNSTLRLWVRLLPAPRAPRAWAAIPSMMLRACASTSP